MNCQEFLDLYDVLLDSEADGDVGPDEVANRRCDVTTLAALREHRETCAQCRSSIADAVELSTAIRALPKMVAPPPPSFERRSGESTWRLFLTAGALSGVAALITVVLLLQWGRRDGAASTPVVGVQVKSSSGWENASASPAGVGRLHRTTDQGVRLRIAANVVIDIGPESYFRKVEKHRIRLESGEATVRIRRRDTAAVSVTDAFLPEEFVLETPVAEVRAKDIGVADGGGVRDGSVRGAVFAARVRPLNDNPLLPEDPEMSSTLKVVPIAAVVSVFVSLGTVTVYNSLGSVDVEANEFAQIEQDAIPELLRLPEEISALRDELTATHDAVVELEKSAPEVARKIQERLKAVEAKLDSEDVATAEDDEPAAGASEDPEALLDEAEELFASLTKSGFSAYASPKLVQLAERLGGLEDGGRQFVLDALLSEDSDDRFVAAALAEKMKNPALINDLKAAAIEDENFMVRRMSSHALAFMKNEKAAGSLVEIIEKETRDPGVALNAWYGLAEMKHPRTAAMFERVLDRAGGDVPADMVVGTALKTADPSLLPALRKAYDRDNVSKPLKIGILQTLAKAESGEYGNFVRQVANDANAPEELRKAAQASLDGE